MCQYGNDTQCSLGHFLCMAGFTPSYNVSKIIGKGINLNLEDFAVRLQKFIKYTITGSCTPKLWRCSILPALFQCTSHIWHISHFLQFSIIPVLETLLLSCSLAQKLLTKHLITNMHRIKKLEAAELWISLPLYLVWNEQGQRLVWKKLVGPFWWRGPFSPVHFPKEATHQMTQDYSWSLPELISLQQHKILFLPFQAYPFQWVLQS